MHPIVKLVGQRVGLGLLLLLAVSALIFIGVELLPGDVAQAILGQTATETSLRNLREEMGLDQPALTRYFGWLVLCRTRLLEVQRSHCPPRHSWRAVAAVGS